ncbi:tRNA epoxyqueuosine(34) reductase QueG [Thermaerobacter subterraneus]|uniref:Fe-S protein n=1 Tax=Thermaerobacter subterraneus DSM 13965 TaxID=867903 RepID=K6Q3Y6_9FIRM|nr:tRNA epoxyqueuosine(34) reductase QueG [Thermaerobacter subterraneus]EKP95834.1 putative Fe-S protein [Thermaerobacter subterraneus DSM 13965]
MACPDPAGLKRALLAEARRLGFVAAGVAAAAPQVDLEWLLRRRQAQGMATPWEDPDPARRADPSSLLPGARSVVAVAMAYDPPRTRRRAAEGQGPREGTGDRGGRREPPSLRGYVAAAGRTRSYQHVMTRRLQALGRWLEATVPGGCRWAVQVDTGPLVDRAWARQAGIGWIGKNACLIVPGAGSWVFLGELVTDVELPPDQPLADACAGCDLCLRACPTGAFLAPRQLDPRRCISFLSQKPGMLDEEERAALGQSLYGCDACQAVCPFNRRAVPGHPALRPRPGDPEDPAAPLLPDLLAMGRAAFQARYRPLTGAWRGRKAWQRNAIVALGNRGPAARPAVPALARVLLGDPRPDLRALAAWALARIGGDAAREALERARAQDPDAAVRQAAARALAEGARPARKPV